MIQETSPTSIIIDLIKVTKVYAPDVEALVEVSLSIHAGELVFLTGMSGAGKTTLLRLISRMEHPTKGLVEVAGIDLAKLPQRSIHLLRRRIGMAYQDFKLLNDKTVADNIAIAMEVAYRQPAFIEKRTRELLHQLDMTRKYSTRTGELSRGEQQRVAIARAVANYPEIILADEPTGNLDAETTAKVMELFHQLNQNGATIVIATHDSTIYQQATHRIVTLHAGRLRASAFGSPTAFSDTRPNEDSAPTEEALTS
ncbi:cell division ATP-binding protein FtsE [Desulfobulbus alkaliphilus]|uniref:cell division ATP-binding protein FtsE n=1 Tax=Desulfobulbus alkaliphilus TaxID=869814 RepID=UPI001962EB2E|nr:cell division ATP-binding protein FtsE [Desulfobulbus alkaliphilus]MBM9536995.1 cell division ATP-binding protein FtsE [Desulfobulbus alkaliphilus]